jgi:hypothetical protein
MAGHASDLVEIHLIMKDRPAGQESDESSDWVPESTAEYVGKYQAPVLTPTPSVIDTVAP